MHFRCNCVRVVYDSRFLFKFSGEVYMEFFLLKSDENFEIIYLLCEVIQRDHFRILIKIEQSVDFKCFFFNKTILDR